MGSNMFTERLWHNHSNSTSKSTSLLAFNFPVINEPKSLTFKTPKDLNLWSLALSKANKFVYFELKHAYSRIIKFNNNKNFQSLDARDNLIEEVLAALEENDLNWIYPVSAPNLSVAGTKIEAIAADVPGNETVETITII